MTITWKNYNSVAYSGVLTLNTDIIVYHLGDSMESYFKCLTRPERTRFIKKELIKLGHHLGYKVYANGLNEQDLKEIGVEFVNREWLFDIHWYLDADNPYTVRSLPLAVECEWNPRRTGDGKTPFSGIKYDFQKLLVTNAECRLMIFTIKNLRELQFLGNYFNEAIQGYMQLPKGSSFLFIAYDAKMLSFHYCSMAKF
ncbi:hypothetical protein EOD41_12420 [Mucilaginibacter limnophilus]|uniref:Uncharacterized protein n=1 Tax=Mucilaginibacter limnophilus TaxID=1932778 RepID=A0A3S3TG30_9SPHI|nr:hypothetical protein [Mucilaginibacter limnophilus]RVU00282.1 hypothetical protein EOD41_12420 [Mucilaginibacter limnophilus]